MYYNKWSIARLKLFISIGIRNWHNNSTNSIRSRFKEIVTEEQSKGGIRIMIEEKGWYARKTEIEIERERQKITPRNWVVNWSVLQHACRNQPVFGWNLSHLPCATISLSLLFPLLLLCIPASTHQSLTKLTLPLRVIPFISLHCSNLSLRHYLSFSTLHSLSCVPPSEISLWFFPCLSLFDTSLLSFSLSLSFFRFCYLWLSTSIVHSSFALFTSIFVRYTSLFLSLSLSLSLSLFRFRYLWLLTSIGRQHPCLFDSSLSHI